MQTDLFTQLEKQKDRAVYAAGAFADPEWKKNAIAAVGVLCRRGEDFTGDDVWALLEGTNSITPEPRALGAIILNAARAGKIYPTGGYRKSMRKSSHRRPLQVWRPVQYRRVMREAE